MLCSRLLSVKNFKLQLCLVKRLPLLHFELFKLPRWVLQVVDVPLLVAHGLANHVDVQSMFVAPESNNRGHRIPHEFQPSNRRNSKYK